MDVFRGIATFYITKHAGNYGHAIDEIERIGFRRLEVFGDNVAIWVKKVGLFIGLRGQNVDAVQKTLNKKVYIREFEGEAEDHICNCVCDERDMATANLEYDEPYLDRLSMESLNDEYYPPKSWDMD